MSLMKNITTDVKGISGYVNGNKVVYFLNDAKDVFTICRHYNEQLGYPVLDAEQEYSDMIQKVENDFCVDWKECCDIATLADKIREESKADFKQAKEELERLYVAESRPSLKKICEDWEGHNYDEAEAMFDCNYSGTYARILVTVKETEKGYIITSGEVYSKNGSYIGNLDAKTGDCQFILEVLSNLMELDD